MARWANEGRLFVLRSVLREPMQLRLFVSPISSPDATAKDFEEPDGYEAANLEFSDWKVDKDCEARTSEFEFTFTEKVNDLIHGWVLVLRRGSVVVGYDEFDRPYPINSQKDKIGVVPILRF